MVSLVSKYVITDSCYGEIMVEGRLRYGGVRVCGWGGGESIPVLPQVSIFFIYQNVKIIIDAVPKS